MSMKQLRPAAAACLLMLTMSLLSTGLSFFVAPVCEELGFGRGMFTLYYSLMVATGAVSISMLGAYMNQHGVRNIALISAVWCAVCLWGFSVSHSLWMFYVAGAVMGFFGTSCVYLCANLIVQQSYSSEGASTILGVVMAGSGIGGVLWSNITPWILEAFGWRNSYRILAVVWAALILVSVVILGKEQQGESIGNPKAISGGASKKEAMRSVKFYLAVVVMCVLTICSCISQQLPSLLEGMGYSAGQVGLMLSVMTGSSAVGMVMEGMLCSRFGVKRILTGFVAGYAVGYLMLCNANLTYPALVLMACGSGTISTLMPVLVRQIFGGRDYAAIWSVVITCSSVASFLSTPVWGMVYDMFGTYLPALLAMPVLLVISLACLRSIFKK